MADVDRRVFGALRYTQGRLKPDIKAPHLGGTHLGRTDKQWDLWHAYFLYRSRLSWWRVGTHHSSLRLTVAEIFAGSVNELLHARHSECGYQKIDATKESNVKKALGNYIQGKMVEREGHKPRLLQQSVSGLHIFLFVKWRGTVYAGSPTGMLELAQVEGAAASGATAGQMAGAAAAGAIAESAAAAVAAVANAAATANAAAADAAAVAKAQVEVETDVEAEDEEEGEVVEIQMSSIETTLERTALWKAKALAAMKPFNDAAAAKKEAKDNADAAKVVSLIVDEVVDAADADRDVAESLAQAKAAKQAAAATKKEAKKEAAAKAKQAANDAAAAKQAAAAAKKEAKQATKQAAAATNQAAKQAAAATKQAAKDNAETHSVVSLIVAEVAAAAEADRDVAESLAAAKQAAAAAKKEAKQATKRKQAAAAAKQAAKQAAKDNAETHSVVSLIVAEVAAAAEADRDVAESLAAAAAAKQAAKDNAETHSVVSLIGAEVADVVSQIVDEVADARGAGREVAKSLAETPAAVAAKAVSEAAAGMASSKHNVSGVPMNASASWNADQDEALKRLVSQHNAGNWTQIAAGLEGKTPRQCRNRWLVLDPNVVKGPWKSEEDGRLRRLVDEIGLQWSRIAAAMNGRNGRQCRERWVAHLSPDISKEPWSKAEEDALIAAHEKMGSKWSEMTNALYAIIPIEAGFLMIAYEAGFLMFKYHTKVTNAKKGAAAKRSAAEANIGEYRLTSSCSSSPSLPLPLLPQPQQLHASSCSSSPFLPLPLLPQPQ
eukprot:COSAG06_NODE_2200_length_7363_cov_78.787996_6_plen_776_part_01